MFKNAGELNLSAAKVDVDQGCSKTMKRWTTRYCFKVENLQIRPSSTYLVLGSNSLLTQRVMSFLWKEKRWYNWQNTFFIFFNGQGDGESKPWKTGSLSHFQNLRVRSWASYRPDNSNSAGSRSAYNNQLIDGWPQWKTTHHPLIPASAKESGASHKAMIYTLLLLSNHQAFTFIALMFL